VPVPTYRFGEFDLDCARFELRREGQAVKLERIPMELLILLAEKDGNVATRPEIRERLWGKEVFVDTEHGINTAIRKIRAALQEDADQPRFVQTVPGKGYRFVAENNDSLQPLELAPPAKLTSESAEAAPVEIAKTRSPIGWILGTAAAAILLAAAAAVGFNLGEIRDLIFARNQVHTIHSIAVLPLTNLSGDPSQDYYADGMTDELITALAANRSLRVVSRTSVMQYKGVNKPLRQIAQGLGVDGILEGSVNRSTNQIHINLQLIYAPTDTHVWAQSFDRDLTSAMSLPEELSQTIAAQAKVAAAPARPKHPISPEAHDDYLRGRYFWFAAKYDRSMEYFEKAVKLQSDYAAAWDGLGDTYAARAVGREIPPQDAFAELKAAAGKALELDDSLPEAHNSMAALYLFNAWDWQRANAESLRAIQLNPNYAEARHLHSYILTVLNRGDEALQEQKRSSEIDPFARPWALGMTYIQLRQYDAAINELRLRADAGPSDPTVRFFLSEAYWLKGMWKESEEESEKALRLIGDSKMAEAQHRAFEQGGEKAAEQLAVSSILARAAKQYVSPFDVAMQYAFLGDQEQTLKFLDAAYRERSPWLPFLQNEPVFDFLHPDPRYRALVNKIGLPPAD